jgi:hemolysin activation/secretion protein
MRAVTHAGLALAVTWAAFVPVQAQSQTSPAAPTGGGLLQQPALQPPLAAPRNDIQLLPSAATPEPGFAVSPGLKVLVRSVNITGATVYSDAELQPLLADQLGQELDFTQLQALARRITTYYQAHGYLLARAVLPAQKISDGVLAIKVEEGKLGKVRLQALPPADPAVVEHYLGGLRQLEGQVLRRAPLERELLVLNDLPGVHLRSVLEPGKEDGTADLRVEVSAERRVDTSLIFDNYGNRYTGEYRVTGRVLVSNPWRFGDSLDASLTYGFTGYRYGRAAWQTPVGSSGTQLGVAGSLMSYTLGKEFEPLDAHGRATDLTLYALQPLQRSRRQQLQAQLALDLKKFDDSANGATSTKKVQVLSANLSSRLLYDAGAVSLGSLTLSLGRLDLDATSAAGDALGYRTEGSYLKLSGQGEYEHPLGGGFSGALRLSGQLASKNLDSSEKFSLGGPQAVRAFAVGEVGADDALLGTLELRKRFGGERDTIAKLFVDGARGRLAHAPLPQDTDNLRKFGAVGVGLDTRLPGDVLLQTALAWRIAGSASAHLDRNPRLWLLVAKNF